ncbi:unnamed protein product [Caenorhabditis auriculariae]|uniref:DOMON domain-containing protein n=1 Tax=Caenorhabditis auriculariae TaxID=2777116 RepID=A0A8S1HU48_9PELO|nr:unnamed protein product [Caenorhabditis auriculariae]
MIMPFKSLLALLFVTAQLTTAIHVTHVSDCGVNRGCWRVPEGCTNSADCKAIVTWRHHRTSLTIELEAGLQNEGNDEWIGVGFSKDRQMGNDTVFECHFSETTPSTAYLSHNSAKRNVVLEKASSLLLKDAYAERFDGRGICGAEWKLDNFALSSEDKRLVHIISSGQYYLMIATGNLQKGKKEMHKMSGKLAPWISNEPTRFCHRCSASVNNIDFVKA